MTTPFKLNRRYQLIIEGSDGSEIEVKDPMTLEIVISRNILSSVNNGVFRIYNLSEDTRNLLQKDLSQVGDRRSIQLKAGYGDSLFTIFAGNVLGAYSSKQGTDIITEIIGFDGGHAITNSAIERTIKAGTTERSIANTLIESMASEGVKKGVIGEVTGESSRKTVLDGRSYDLLKERFEGKVFIDNETINILADNEYLDGFTPVLSKESGLLQTPEVQDRQVTVELLFEPRLVIGQLFEINTDVQTKLFKNQQLKVMSIEHMGTFSNSVGGSMVTRVGSLIGIDALKGVSQ